jgi:hypothetical protein
MRLDFVGHDALATIGVALYKNTPLYNSFDTHNLLNKYTFANFIIYLSILPFIYCLVYVLAKSTIIELGFVLYSSCLEKTLKGYIYSPLWT